MKKNILVLILIASFASLVSCKGKLPVKDITITTQDNRNVAVRAEVADDFEERQFGFMERKHIPDGTGMIFVFEYDQILSFWMKNTPHPLSIAYIDRTGCIKDIYDMTPYSLAPVVSRYSVRYALEVPQGWFKANNIKEGDMVDISSFIK